MFLGLLVLCTVVCAVGWYRATKPGSQQHFSSCQIDSDGVMTLDYTYGAGDDVTTSVASTASGIKISLRLHRASGPVPAIALHGQVVFDTFGGLRDLPVMHEDGSVLTCLERSQ